MRCPNCDYVFNHRDGGIPARIIETIEIEQWVQPAELPALIADAKPESIRQACYRMLKSGALITDPFGYVHVQLGRTT